ncbi:ferrous iron transport protein B [Lachnoclostridium phytofermentans]|uniref:ferrous iron transport protein B n=1 Tax=Lachnoclostridium phytofermentans TaxID=66219 RepID=UPI0004985645|nr:ferrous iron transport protein B [Lachnoclostridium phytofermentans]
MIQEENHREKQELKVGFVGNPNCGKTTLFNAYTGAKLKVANWPGVTVEKKEGAMKYHDHRFKLVDLPGIYSLTSYTMEEKLTRQFILDSEVDVIVDVADASALERNLYLTLQLIELGKPVILALNMMDIVEERGMEIDMHRLPEMLGIPCIPVSARRRTGLDILMHTVAHHKEKCRHNSIVHQHPNKVEEESSHAHEHHHELTMVYSDEIEDKIDVLIDRMMEIEFETENYRWYALKLLEHDEEVMNLVPIDLSGIADKSYEAEIIHQKYDFLKGYFEVGFESFSSMVLNGLESLGTSEILISLLVDGIIAGVGGILTFLPNIFILFLALAFLEDSGYMARVAYVMDGLMGKLGLSGRAFIPMILGFGCTVPAVMASRALEDMRDRRRTVLVTPFMSCSARLPIYVLFSQMFFGRYAMLAAFSMYVIGLVIAVISAFVMNKLGNKGSMSPLLIELPEYKTPNKRTIIIYVWDKVKDYLTKAGTTIFLASIVIWFILNFGPQGMTEDMSQSFGAIFGKFLSPILVPAGLGLWQVVVALISGLAAKEVVVSSFSVLYGIANISSGEGMDNLINLLSSQNFTAINAYSFMLFCLLYTPCVATIAVVKRELNSTKWTIFSILFQLSVAYLVSVLFFQIASFITSL